MNQIFKFRKSISVVILSLLSTFMTFAQDEAPSLDVNINTGGGEFYTQIWFWVVIGLVFILLLVALLRGGGNKQ